MYSIYDVILYLFLVNYYILFSIIYFISLFSATGLARHSWLRQGTKKVQTKHFRFVHLVKYLFNQEKINLKFKISTLILREQLRIDCQYIIWEERVHTRAPLDGRHLHTEQSLPWHGPSIRPWNNKQRQTIGLNLRLLERDGDWLRLCVYVLLKHMTVIGQRTSSGTSWLWFGEICQSWICSALRVSLGLEHISLGKLDGPD